VFGDEANLDDLVLSTSNSEASCVILESGATYQNATFEGGNAPNIFVAVNGATLDGAFKFGSDRDSLYFFDADFSNAQFLSVDTGSGDDSILMCEAVFAPGNVVNTFI
jgi:uncharacterized protein YjbI with pentapeptide repeats